MSSKSDFAQRPTSTSLTDDKENSAPATESKDEPNAPLGHHTHYSLLLIAILIMLIWPWVFFGVVWQLGGIQMNAHVAKVVTDNPHSTNFFVTLIGNIVCLIINILFSLAVIRFGQKWVIENQDQDKHITVFQVSLLSAFRHQSFPWGKDDLRSLLIKTRWSLAFLVIVCIGSFTFVPSATTSLISPVPFNKTAHLTGTELNFASTAPDCVNWFNVTRISETCDWRTFKDVEYTSCLGENQMVDVLESGRSNILSLLSNNSQSLTFSQLGAKDGLHFLGPLRGVLPIGPNGVPAFDTLSYSPLSDTNSRAAMLSYNYTLNLQGLISNVKCAYSPDYSPIKFWAVPGTSFVYQYNGTCPSGSQELLTNSTFVPKNSNNSLGFWACKNPSPEGDQYVLYLSGRVNYAQAIGNINCTASPIQPAIFPVTYQSRSGYFSSQNHTGTFANTSSELIERAIKGLATVIYESQTTQSNLVAESVITFGVKSFGLPPYNQSEKYLQLYEAMFQGVLEYEATYTRLIYSTVTNPAPPSSCIRNVTGVVKYEVTGWFVKPSNIGFLLPMTAVNLAALILTLMAMFMGKRVLYRFDPTDPKWLIFASHDHDTEAAGAAHRWDYRVTFNEGINRFRQQVGVSSALNPFTPNS